MTMPFSYAIWLFMLLLSAYQYILSFLAENFQANRAKKNVQKRHY